MQIYLFKLGDKTKIVDCSDFSSDDFCEAYKRFAKECGKLSDRDWLAVECYRLYEDQKIGNIYYLDEFCDSGAYFTLIQLSNITDDEIENAKKYLYENRDVISINIVKER